MWLHGLKADVPVFGSNDDNISVDPYSWFGDYFGQQKIKVYK
jgi:hypothetical protein